MNACKILTIAYKEFLSRRKFGMSINQACQFEDIQSFHDSFCSSMHLDDVSRGFFELRRNNLIYGANYDNTLYNIRITDSGLSVLERLMYQSKKDVIDRIKSTVPLLLDVLSHFP